jgi:hypothetical protein
VQKSYDQRERRDREKVRRRVQNQVERLEKQLADLEKEEKELQASVMKGGLPADQVQRGYERMGELAQRIATVMAEWESTSQQLHELEEEAKKG